MAYPTEYRYTEQHEWIHLEGNRAKVGITEYAQGELGDIVYVELPEVGKKVGKGETLATVESVKSVSDVYAPVAGEVVEVNGALESAPETINNDPHGAGWIVILEIADPKEIDSLLDAAAYEKLIASE
ncbi:glycine cleavage system protein GcvH [Candidatus Acetothermia bacterium]|nr:MAG: glycine cleavage system protein GcvH [Candidatus Acetothermia bacterium]